jgi:hypothetical protein
MTDSEILQRLLAGRSLRDDERAVLERVVPRLRLEEDLARTRRAEDDTAPLGPVRP